MKRTGTAGATEADVSAGVLITVERACGGETPTDEALGSWIELTLLEAGGAAPRTREVGVRIVDETEGGELNRRYRDRDGATNVLSFPAAAGEAFAALDEDEPLPLGDLVFCGPLIAREAAEQHKAPAHHWAHLAVHGTLHLLGYDHDTEREARAMEELEVRILGRRGIDDPYRQRESA